MKPSDFLKRGWCQGRFIDEHYNVCFVGGVQEAAFLSAHRLTIELDKFDPHREEYRYKFCDKAAELLGLAASKGWDAIRAMEAWNDLPERTQEEVIALAERVEEALGL